MFPIASQQSGQLELQLADLSEKSNVSQREISDMLWIISFVRVKELTLFEAVIAGICWKYGTRSLVSNLFYFMLDYLRSESNQLIFMKIISFYSLN
ncbi:hypothetical protein AVEN_97187-1 [Araneus ventricosus]|uniref:Uncharacterized protein n=1 Tax=Araneus ventricosus TaxID=182803 RepID=A0A4Y2DEZ4_ARAVE|nr:hypothetical protein AVEN_97187-1 [Araneus ventricosus]